MSSKSKSLSDILKSSDNNEKEIYFTGSMLFISAETQKLRDINLLKNMMQFHIEQDKAFWFEDHKKFMTRLLKKKKVGLKKMSASSNVEQKPRVMFNQNSCPNLLKSFQKPVLCQKSISQDFTHQPQKRVSVQQTSAESFDVAPQLQQLCKNCMKIKGKGRVRALVQLFNKINSSQRSGAIKKKKHSTVFKFSPDYFKKSPNKAGNYMIFV